MKNEDITEFIRSRFSVRQFTNKDVPEKLIKRIIETGISAPSACNVQGWRFVIVKDKTTKLDLINKGIDKLQNVPAGIFVFYTNQRINKKYNDQYQSAAACIQNMLLEAHNLGLGACWICDLPDKNIINSLLNVPLDYYPIAMIKLGYPNKNVKKIVFSKFSVDELTHLEKFNPDKDKCITKSVFKPNRPSYRLKRILTEPRSVAKYIFRKITQYFNFLKSKK